MKFQPDQASQFFINAYDDRWIAVNGEKHQGSIVVNSLSGVLPWPYAKPTDLDENAFVEMAGSGVEIILFGSGSRLAFPSTQWLKPLIQQGIGLETMDTAAACRTFNVLSGEGRKVAAALMLNL